MSSNNRLRSLSGQVSNRVRVIQLLSGRVNSVIGHLSVGCRVIQHRVKIGYCFFRVGYGPGTSRVTGYKFYQNWLLIFSGRVQVVLRVTSFSKFSGYGFGRFMLGF